MINAFSRTGTLNAAHNKITWSNGVIWNKGKLLVPNISGDWSTDSGLGVMISQSDLTFTFAYTDGSGTGIIGKFRTTKSIIISGNIGSLNSSSTTIAWADGHIYTKGKIVVPSLTGDWTNNLGAGATITQSDLSLGMVMSTGETSTGSFVTKSLIKGWGMTATVNLSASTITWSNGIIWTRGSLVLPNLTGAWSNSWMTGINVMQSGANLAFTFSDGQSGIGILITATKIKAFGMVGSLDVSGTHVIWSNGVTWTKGTLILPALAGGWSNSALLMTFNVVQVGSALSFAISNGQTGSGKFTTPNTISAWGLTGQINAAADSIAWSNGQIWKKGPLALPNLAGNWTNSFGSALVVVQTGTSLTIQFATGENYTGVFGTTSTINAFGIVGTINAAGTLINWSNGVTWIR